MSREEIASDTPGHRNPMPNATKSKALEKALVAAREQARILEDKAMQSGRTVRAAKDKLRQAKGQLKLAKEEVREARKAAKAAKRACAEATDASEEAAAEVAGLEKRVPAAPVPAAPARAKSGKSKRARRRKSASARPGPGAATARSKKPRSAAGAAVPDEPDSGESAGTVPPNAVSMEVQIQMPSDIAVPTDVFSGNPAQGDGFVPPGSETSSQ